jgi:hypothetical protein
MHDADWDECYSSSLQSLAKLIKSLVPHVLHWLAMGAFKPAGLGWSLQGSIHKSALTSPRNHNLNLYVPAYKLS